MTTTGLSRETQFESWALIRIVFHARPPPSLAKVSFTAQCTVLAPTLSLTSGRAATGLSQETF